MKITSIEAIPTRIALKKPFKIALGTQTRTQNVIVRMEDDEGNVGWSETTTLHVIYGYDQQMLHHAVSEVLAPAVMGLDPRDMESIHEMMDLAIPENLMAKNGIDLAAYDLVGRATGRSIAELLGGARTSRIPIIQVVGLESPEVAAADATAFVAAGHQTIKVKIGLDPEADLARVRAVREAVGDDVHVRADGNQGYDRETARRVIDEMGSLRLELVEQPLPDWDFAGHAELAAAFDTPIALDESIHTIHDVHRVAELGAADIINIKVNRVGGIYKARSIVAACADAGIPCLLGSNIETSPGTAAWANFFAATDNMEFAVEVIGPAMYADDLVTEPLLPQNGFLHLPPGHGMGVEVNLEKLERYRVCF